MQLMTKKGVRVHDMIHYYVMDKINLLAKLKTHKSCNVEQSLTEASRKDRDDKFSMYWLI